MVKRLVVSVILAALAVSTMLPGVAVAQGKSICMVTFSLQVAYFQNSVAGAQSSGG